MKNIKCFYHLTVFLLICTNLHAVNPPTNLEVKLKYQTISANFNPLKPLESIDQSGDAYVSFIIQLSSTDISSINIVLKRSILGEVLIEKSFIYGVSGSLPDSTTYNSIGDVVELGLGSFNNMTTYFAEVKVTDTLGNVSYSIIKNK